MRHDPIDPQLFLRNRERLRSLLDPGAIVLLVSNDIMPTNADGTMSFRQNSDLLYLSGIDQEDTALVLFPDAVTPEDREILFVRETSELIAIWEGAKLNQEEAAAQSGIERVEWSRSFEATLARLVPQAEVIYLLTNEHLRAVNRVETANDRLIKKCRSLFPLHRYERLAPLMGRLRMIKDPVEIALIRRACEITEAGFRRVLDFVKPGVGEWEIEAELIHEFLRRKSRGFAYGPIIGSGANACVLHYVENNQICKDGELILLDVAAEYAGWASDMTRTIPANGRFTKRQREVYDAVLRVLRGSNEILRPGLAPADYQNQVVEMMAEELAQLGLIQTADLRGEKSVKPLVSKYFMHGIGHHMGLDVHDVAPPHQKVAPGMVFTIEPGIYIREEGLGVRLENNFVVGESGNTDLMASIPIEAEEIEELMNA